MNVGRTHKRILIYIVLLALGVYFGLRLFAQYRHVPVYVTRVAPTPTDLATKLHREEHKISPMISIETPYENAEEKKLTPAEIGRLRSCIAWSRALPPFIDALTIETPTNVVARRTTKRVIVEYRLAKRGDKWFIEDVNHSPIDRVSP